MLHLWFLYQKVNNNNQCLLFLRIVLSCYSNRQFSPYAGVQTYYRMFLLMRHTLWWVTHLLTGEIIAERSVSRPTKKRETEIGGLDSNGIPIVVEIDESLFFNRKYHRGSVRSNHWVFGGIERGTRKCFAVEASNRKRDTLEDVINKYVLPGSYIMSDICTWSWSSALFSSLPFLF